MSDNTKIGNHAMLDIETLSTDSNAFITQIAIKTFNPLGLVASDVSDDHALNVYIDVWEPQKGSHIDGKTVEWWQKQPCEAKKFLYTRRNVIDLANGLTQLRDFIATHKIDYVWSRSPSFDVVIVNNAAKRALGELIIPYWKERDHRTLHSMLDLAMGEKHKLDNSHNALEDCENQIKLVQLFYKEFHGRGKGDL